MLEFYKMKDVHPQKVFDIGRFNTLSIQLLYMINVDEEGELEMLSTCTTINCILSRFHEKYSL